MVAIERAAEVDTGARKPAWKERPVVIRVSIVCREERRCRRSELVEATSRPSGEGYSLI